MAIVSGYDEPHALLDQALAGLAVAHHLLGNDDAAIRAALGKEEARRARDEGAAMSLDAALAYALEGLD